jgi:hypothetical protein
MPKDYTPYGTHHAPLRASHGVYGDLRDQFTASDEMVASTLSFMLHKAHARIALLEAEIKYHERDPLRLAYDKLEATGASLVFVGEIRAGDTPRIRESGELLAVLEALAGRAAMFGTQVVELNVNEKLAS